MKTHPEDRFLILGAGRFGRLSAIRLGRRRPEAVITVVDRDADKQKELAASGHRLVTADGIDYLVQVIKGDSLPEWIVPALPIHVARLWLRRRLAEAGFRVEDPPVAEAVESLVPHPLRGDNGQLYASNADFICPDDCPEPERFCTVTGKPRPVVMFSHLAGLRIAEFS